MSELNEVKTQEIDVKVVRRAARDAEVREKVAEYAAEFASLSDGSLDIHVTRQEYMYVRQAARALARIRRRMLRAKGEVK